VSGCCRRWLFLLTLLGVLGSLTWPSSGSAAELTVTFFDIGQGDAALVVSPTGKRVLFDGGPPEAGERLLAALLRHHVEQLDLVVLTHPHADHLGGLKRVVGALPVRMFLDAAYPSTSPGYTGLLSLLGSRGVAVKQATAGRQIDLGDGAQLTLLGPPSPWLTNTRSDVNANSVVARLSWRGRTALFTGDAEPETERWLLTRPAGTSAQGGGMAGGESLAAELLKVAHHGGKYSSTTPFLQAVAPRLAVISVGAGNDYGHPTAEALGRLAAVGARVLRTDQDGEVNVRSRDGQPWRYEGPEPKSPTPGLLTPPTQPPIPPPTPPRALPAAGSSTDYVASSRSPVFHRSDCSGAQRIVAGNLVHFATRQAALASGRRPAEDCHP
jgi:beta-lactamase superfamily II metal-dependent hydrolase